MKVFFTYLITICILLFSCKPKQEPQTNNTETEKTETSIPGTDKFVIDATKDAEYVVDTYAKGLYAIKAAEIVKQNAKDEAIIAVAEQVTRTHQNIIGELGKLAGAKKISLPSGLNMAQLTELNKLSAEVPGKLEQVFIDQMESEHKKDIELLEKISKESEDNEISTVAIACLSQVKSQYDEVIGVKEELDL